MGKERPLFFLLCLSPRDLSSARSRESDVERQRFEKIWGFFFSFAFSFFLGLPSFRLGFSVFFFSLFLSLSLFD